MSLQASGQWRLLYRRISSRIVDQIVDQCCNGEVLKHEELDVVSVLVAAVFWSSWGMLSLVSLAQILGLLG